MSIETKTCEECRGYGHGVHPNGSDWDCETCDGEGEVCAACGGSRCVWEGECVAEDERRRADEMRRKYEERHRTRRALLDGRVAALNVALGSLRVGAVEPHVTILAELRDELAKEVADLDRIAQTVLGPSSPDAP